MEINGKTRFSTFFPDSWNRVKVLDEIKYAGSTVNNFSKAGWYVGKTQEGMKVKMWLNDKGIVDTAFPIYSRGKGGK
ncbi:hypothetical protein CJ485_24100 [Priestia filamentosa]|nr:hypothetical protein CJ485_24100 [Priestia filamentosa]